MIAQGKLSSTTTSLASMLCHTHLQLGQSLVSRFVE